MSSEVSQRVRFECCYLVDSNINAHEYQLEVTVVNSSENVSGRVMNFEDLQYHMDKIVPNNRFLFDTTSQNVGRDVAFLLGQRGIAITGYGFALSTENLCSYFGTTLQNIFSVHFPSVTVKSVKLRENANSYALWRPDFSVSL